MVESDEYFDFSDFKDKGMEHRLGYKSSLFSLFNFVGFSMFGCFEIIIWWKKNFI